MNEIQERLIAELKELNGQCALISGHSHVYGIKDESKTNNLFGKMS